MPWVGIKHIYISSFCPLPILSVVATESGEGGDGVRGIAGVVEVVCGCACMLASSVP